MAEYVGINSDGLSVSGIWAVDSHLHDTSLTLVELTGEAQLGWTWDGTVWIRPEAPLVSFDGLRVVRDELLRSSDFTQLPDVHSCYYESNVGYVQTGTEGFTRWLYASGRSSVSYEAVGII